MTRRPRLKLRPYIWKSEDKTETPGIGLMHGLKVRAHLSPAEAYAMANRLVDIADSLETAAKEPSK